MLRFMIKIRGPHRDSFARRPAQPSTRVAVWSGLLFLSVLTVMGCRRSPQWDLMPIEGAVTRAARPLAGVQVIFWPEAGTTAPRASGFTNEAGRYELKTDAGERGAAPGKYRVCILEPYNEHDAEEKAHELRLASRRAKARKNTSALSQPKEKRDSMKAPGLSRTEYSQFDKMPLRVEVKPGGRRSMDFNMP